MNAKENLSPTVRSEAPVAGPEQKEIWGSDAIAAVLRTLDIPFLALNPGASYRGLHDSIVNYLGNTAPADAALPARGIGGSDRAGLRQSLRPDDGRGGPFPTWDSCTPSMAIFNAWCDRVPMLVSRRDRSLGRRESAVPGSTGSTPLPTRPRSCAATPSGTTSRRRCRRRTKRSCAPLRSPNTAPRGPTYVNLDAGLQEAKIARSAASRREAIPRARPGAAQPGTSSKGRRNFLQARSIL